jgi:acetylornithine/N-succinyldiaminopimelate aminotransferase
MNSQETIELFERYVVPNYRRYPVCLVRGEGSYVWDAEGNQYLDFFPGWGCNLLGHCPPPVVEAVRDQVGTLIHVPNTWYMEAQGRWAEALSKISFGGQAFFCNSGAEANEAAIKLARLHTPKERYKIITFEKGFHGRTLATTTATAQPAYQAGLGPLMAGFNYAPYDDLDAVRNLIDDETCAILVEPVQGEGGVNIPGDGFLVGLRELADENELLLIFDEVQSGMGRTGRWFGYQHWNVVPDVMSLAKALGGGIACGAILTRPEIAPSLRPGMHAATFGGNPIAARAGLATIEMIQNEGLLEHAQAMSDRFRGHLEPLVEKLEIVRTIRVLGMMIGLELEVDAAPFVQKCMEKRLLINGTQQTVIRLLPALNVSPEQVDDGCRILTEVLEAGV